MGVEMGFGGHEFFVTYREGSRLTAIDFGIPVSYGVGLKITANHFSYGLDAGYLIADLGDNGVVSPAVQDSSRKLSLTEKMTLKAATILGTAEYVALWPQFHTYVGVGLGVSRVQFRWDEAVSSTIPGDNRTGGLLLEETKYIPSGRVYSGVELGFDDAISRSGIAGSLIIEVHYTYLPYKTSPFATWENQLAFSKELSTKEFSIASSSLAIYVGVQFTFHKSR
jgi:opacity protein-like surface antigen